MTDDVAESTPLTGLIAAHDVAIRVLADTRADAAGDAAKRVDASFTPKDAARRRTTSGMLLERAAAAVGVDQLAATLGIPTDALTRFLGDGKTMTLAQQRTLALSVLLLCDGNDDLRRKATALLGQVSAAADFEAGVTPRHASPPPSNLGWR